MNKLNEAIKHYKQITNKCNINAECKEEHLQLAKWLIELKRFRMIIANKLEIYSKLRNDVIDFVERNIVRDDKSADSDYKISIIRTAKDIAEDVDIKVRILDEILEYANENYESTHKISAIFNP